MKLEADVVLVGAGITGLWLLNILSQQGYRVILLDNTGIGGWQSLHSQGIIHRGVKYIGQKNKQSALEISRMASIWHDCLNFEKEDLNNKNNTHGLINLSKVPVLSQGHLIWTKAFWFSRLKNFIASRMLVSVSKVLSKKEHPEVFKNKNFSGSLCDCQELVLDVPSLIKTLAMPYLSQIFLVPKEAEKIKYEWGQEDNQLCLKNMSWIDQQTQEAVQLSAKTFILTAGEGIEVILKKLSLNHMKFKNIKWPRMQRRPLHMVFLKAKNLPELYVHFVQTGLKPLLTLTTHSDQNQHKVWYLGGELAEQGVHRSAADQIQVAKKILSAWLPWVDLSQATFDSFLIDRAEGLTEIGDKPATPVINHLDEINNLITIWPTKLTFAPWVGFKILEILKQKNLDSGRSNSSELLNLLNWQVSLKNLDIKKAPLLEALWNQQK